MAKKQSAGQIAATAIATWAIGLPLALVVLLYGMDALIWALDQLSKI